MGLVHAYVSDIGCNGCILRSSRCRVCSHACARGGTLALLSTYGAAAVPMSYCLSWLFKDAATAQVAMVAVNVATGFLLTCRVVCA